MKVALPAVGVMDMLRYHTAGAGWAYDYGTAQDSEEMFEYIKGYSPVHNVKRELTIQLLWLPREITMIE
jgi:prolyl oligopeptidase